MGQAALWHEACTEPPKMLVAQCGQSTAHPMMNDLRFALRQLLKQPGLSCVVVLSLALGIGANATALGWVQHLVRRPLPGVQRQGEMVVLVSNEGGGNVSLPDLRDFDQLKEVFVGAAASQITPASVTIDRRPQWIYGQIATANLFDLLGVQPLLGRTFLPDEDRHPGGDAVLVLSETCWRRRFGADPGIIGRSVELNRTPFTVIGVVPAVFQGTMTGLACDFWAPISMLYEVSKQRQQSLVSRNSRGFHNLARLRHGVSVAQAQAAVDTLGDRLAGVYPDTHRGVRHRVVPYARCPYGAQAVLGPVLRLILGASVGVLLIVTANVANLLLARASSRQKEIAIRLAAGASRARLTRQLLTESCLLALIGGALGLLLSRWGDRIILAFMPAVQLPLALAQGWDAGVTILTLLITVSTGLAFGLVPALQATRPRVYEMLKDGGRASTGGVRHQRLRNGLVIAELALAVVLMVGAGLCWQGQQRARQVDPGFDADHVLVAGLQIGMSGYTEETGRGFYRALQQRLTTVPGVEAAALASWFPLGIAGCKGHGVEVPGYQRPPGENPTYEFTVVSPGYFEVLRIPLVAGRDFGFADDRAAQPVAIVNEHFAARFWPGQDPLGRTFRAGGADRRIIGVAKAGKYRRLDEGPWPVFYLPYTQYVPDLDLSLCLRTAGEPMAYASWVRREVQSLDAGVDVWGTVRLTEHCGAAFFTQRIATHLLATLAAVALFLAAMGVYAVMAYAVSQRHREFGVRRALGAQVRDVLAQVLMDGVRLTVVGLALGLILAALVTRLLAGFLYGVSPFDPWTFVVVPAALGVVAVTACYLPANRAARVDPMVTLRCE